jgi:DNA modification methylase
MSYKIIKINTSKLIPYAGNSRTHSDEQVNQIAASIKEFGFNNPVLVDADNVIIAGHGRVLAAQKIGMDEVPTICLAHLSDAQRRAYVIADNKLAMNAGWDKEALLAEMDRLKDDNFDVSLLGFDDEELGEMYGEEEIEGLTDDDEVPEPPENPTTVDGDIWLLGNHRLMCGDSTSVEVVDNLMPGMASMTFTDPPYLMNFTGGIHADGSKSFNSKHGAIKNDKMSKQDGDNFLDSINTVIKSKVDGAFYITFYRLGIAQYYESLERTGLQCRSLVIWDKGNHTLSNSDYMSMYEPIFYGWVNNHKFHGGSNGMDIWRIQRTARNDLHPTMKPVELCLKAIEDGSQANGVVLDLFGGSGSTLIACEKTNRQCRMMELDPKYCDVIIKRWQEFTGKEATHADTGKTFNESH